MSELNDFVSKTMKNNEEEVKKLQELETILNELYVEQKVSYIRYDVVSNT